MNNIPMISVLMAYYNNLDYVEDAVKSVVEQGYPNFEFIVVDDKSPNTEAEDLIKKLADKYKFKLIRKENNQGAGKAFQTAFENSTGEYISIISHDDMYAQNRFKHMMEIILRDDLDVLYCNGEVFKDDDINHRKKFDSEEVRSAFAKGQKEVYELICSRDDVPCLLTQGAIYKRKVWEDLAWMREKFLLDDWPFTIKVWQDYKTSFDDFPVYLYRQHEDNIHKHYWHWFPARVQTVSELIEPEKKMEVLSFLMGSMADFAYGSKKYDEAYHFASASLIMAEKESNITHAQNLLSKLNGKIKSGVYQSFCHKVGSIAWRNSKMYKFYKPIIKAMLALIPIKKWRKKIKSKVL